MNGKDKIVNELRTNAKYHIPGCVNSQRRTKNTVIIHTANNLPHEMQKFKLCYAIQAMGHEFITEAQRNGEKIIVDVVDLTEDQEFEIVDTHGDIERYKKEGVVPVMVTDII